MSRHDYQISRKIENEDYPFYALVMAAMRQADDNNLEKLKIAWPEIYAELKERYNTAGGFLMSELNEMASRFGKGTQIAYIPDHVDRDDPEHKGWEFGFVTDVNENRGVALCRFWSLSDSRYLRTVANGEWVTLANLVEHDTVGQEVVSRLLDLIDRDELTIINCHV